MDTNRIRPIAICICRDGDRILVFEACDHKKQETFYRPLGGSIEFGERSQDTVCREFQEEIDTQLTEIRFLGVLENIFVYEGKTGHEIVMVYDGQLCDRSLYEKEMFMGDELGTPFKAMWKRLDEFGPGRPPLYPDGLLELLQSA